MCGSMMDAFLWVCYIREKLYRGIRLGIKGVKRQGKENRKHEKEEIYPLVIDRAN
jgi:hypothetical protein